MHTSSDDKAEAVASFYSNLFAEGEPSDVPDWILSKRWTQTDLDALPAIDGELLRVCIFAMALGKTCSEDRVVIEMLRCLDIEVLDVLAAAFRLRLLNHPTEDSDNCWGLHLVAMLFKVPHACKVVQFRPIVVLAVLCKLFFRVIIRQEMV